MGPPVPVKVAWFERYPKFPPIIGPRTAHQQEGIWEFESRHLLLPYCPKMTAVRGDAGTKNRLLEG